jgi:anti-anti-sigma regulatory factor
LHEIKKEVVIFNASDMVENVLRSVNLNKIIPILYSFDAFYQWQASKAGMDVKSGYLDFKLEQRGKIAVIAPDKAGSISSLEMRPDFQKIGTILVSPQAVIDLSQITDFNTIMLCSLAAFAKELQEKGGKLVFTGLDATAQELLSLLDIESDFEYSENVEKAVGSFG